jgi:hypothetical protein
VNTIIAENAGGDCDVSQTASGGIVDNGHNLDSDGTCGLSIATLSLPSTNPLFATVGLADNGGPTPTLALAAGSPAIDAGDDVVCAADPVNGLDQRGVVRPQGTHCDIGAYELIVPTVTAANATAPFFDTAVAFSATVATGCGDSGTYCPVINEGTVTFTVKDSQSNIVGTAGGTVTAGSAAASFTASGLLPGSYTITAAYHDPSGAFANSQGTGTLTITAASTGHASLTIMSPFTPQVQAMVVTGVNGGTPSGSLSYSSSAVKLSQVRLIGLSASGSHASVFGTARLADGTKVNFQLDATAARVGGTVRLRLNNGYDSGALRVLAVRVSP